MCPLSLRKMMSSSLSMRNSLRTSYQNLALVAKMLMRLVTRIRMKRPKEPAQSLIAARRRMGTTRHKLKARLLRRPQLHRQRSSATNVIRTLPNTKTRWMWFAASVCSGCCPISLRILWLDMFAFRKTTPIWSQSRAAQIPWPCFISFTAA